MTVAQSVLTEMNSDRGCFTVSEQGLLAYHAALSDVQMLWMDRGGIGWGRSAGSGAGPRRGTGAGRYLESRPSVRENTTGVAGVWLYDLARANKTRLSSAALYTGTIWSLDGTRVALGIKKDGSYDVVAKNADGAGTEEFFRSKLDVISRKLVVDRTHVNAAKSEDRNASLCLCCMARRTKCRERCHRTGVG